ncbi:hypothetical protein GCM10010218_41990 [Streptomyces mashuensis]|uniref:DUF3558 domain-containing protein n=1 Tax=Streptomyces mashuensis TaxID=33904 RepID=A0A919B5X5_9ACTN|nr:hypothetical protein [Streptomyces mashuensis]GHF56263.1 hypothetical protein GCM10010218_41990 [Streptomyces mashuensis]
MHRRTAPRLARILACAAVPVMLVATGCSSDGDSGSKKESAKPTKSAATPQTAPSVQAARFGKLPEACKTVTEKTIEDIVPKVDKKEGKPLNTGDTNDIASCIWSGLDKEDVKNMQNRVLVVSLKRLTSDPTLGTGEKRAQDFAAQQATAVTTADGATNAKTEKVSGIGDGEAALVSTDTKKNDDEYKNEIVVARTANVVLTVKYSGAGLQGAKSPDPDELKKNAQQAAKDVVKAVADANK